MAHESQRLSAHQAAEPLQQKQYLMKKCKIYYIAMPDEWRKEEKLEWLAEHPLSSISFERITPSKQHNWINFGQDDFESLLPSVDKDVKLGKRQEGAVFKSYTNGVCTNRDEWVFDFDRSNLIAKAEYLSKVYNASVEKNQMIETVKWSRDLRNEFQRKKKSDFKESLVMVSSYRPFIRKFHYVENVFNDVLTQNHYNFFGTELNKENKVINFLSIISSHPLAVLATDRLIDLCFIKLGNGGTQSLPLYTYDANGERHDNITDWGLQQFRQHYNDKRITREDIFHYTYAVLHHPAYRRKYALNLKREFPRPIRCRKRLSRICNATRH